MAAHEVLRSSLSCNADGTQCGCLQLRKQRAQSRADMLGNIYGSALPARMQIERQILRK